MGSLIWEWACNTRDDCTCRLRDEVYLHSVQLLD